MTTPTPSGALPADFRREIASSWQTDLYPSGSQDPSKIWGWICLRCKPAGSTPKAQQWFLLGRIRRGKIEAKPSGAVCAQAPGLCRTMIVLVVVTFVLLGCASRSSQSPIRPDGLSPLPTSVSPAPPPSRVVQAFASPLHSPIATPNSPRETATVGARQRVASETAKPPRFGWSGSCVDKPTASAQAMPTFSPGWANSTPAGAGAITTGGPAIYPLTPMAYHVTNKWWEVPHTGGKMIWVQAGSISRDVSQDHTENQGMIAVIVSLVCAQGTGYTSDWIEVGVYLTPVRAGPVRIVDAVGERLVLKATEGGVFYFDVPARQFVPSLTVAVPSATPLPARSD